MWIYNRVLALAGFGLLMPFLTFWIPNDILVPIITGFLGLGLIAVVIMAVLFIVTALVAGAKGTYRDY